MIPSAMVKFFTSCPLCPLCSTGYNPISNSKCLCVVKGLMVPARSYVVSDDRNKGKEGGTLKGPVRPEKTNEERFFTEIAKKYLKELKKKEDKLKKKPEDSD